MQDKVLREGKRGNAVARLQAGLQQLGYPVGTVDGIFGPKTKSAVKLFQAQHNLPATGIVNQKTSDVLNGLTGALLDSPRITINTDKKMLTLYLGDNVFGQYPVAVGAPQTPSPIGNWQVKNKGLYPGGPFGSRWMGLNVPWGSYGIHGTNNPSSIGKAVSHGCIRMFNEDVETIYPLVAIGTPVRITAE